LCYLALIARALDIWRVFEYYGVEHMTIHALEAGDPLTIDAVRKYSTAHFCCGTEFLVVVILLSVLLFGLSLLGLHWYELDARARKRAANKPVPVPTPGA